MSLRAGAAAADITPPVGIDLAGFVAREQPSVGIHDRLFARALYLENQGQRILWINADLIAFKRSAVRQLTYQIAEEFAIPATQIVFSATHTHSGPPTIPLHYCGELTEQFRNYTETFEAAVCAACRSAICSVEPVTIYGAQTQHPLSQDRRGGQTAHVDHVLGCLGFKAASENWVAMLANYPIHPVVLGPENRMVSGDLLGMAAAQLEKEHQTVALFTNGACGNLNPPSRGDYGQCEAWAKELATACEACLDQPLADETLAALKETYPVPVEQQTGRELKEELIRLREMFQGEPSLWNTRSRLALREWAGMMMHQTYEPLPTDLQVLRIGDFLFACVAAEVFSVLADRLRARHGQRLQVIGYANGNIGYLCPQEAYREGGFEIDSAFMYYGTAPIRCGALEQVEAKLSDMLSQLKR